MLFATCRQRKVHVKQPVDIIQNGIHVDTVRLDMDDEWAGMTSIIATFTNGATAIDVNYTFGQPLDVPWECLQNTGTLTLHFTGYVGTEKVMTTMLPDSGWNVIQNGEISEQSQQEATPTLLEQIAAVAQSVRDDADNGVFDGAGVPEGGTAGQFLKKKSGTDYDTEWADTAAPVLSVNGKTGAVELDAYDVDALPNTTVIPAYLHQLSADSSHRTVTDTEKATWNAKQNKLTAGQNITISGNVISASGGGGGTSDHNALSNRDAANQHPMSAISGLEDALTGKQDTIADIATIRSGATLGATAVQPEAGKGLFSGSYNDLTDKPTIPPAVTDAHINSLIDAKLGDLDTAVTMLEGVV